MLEYLISIIILGLAAGFCPIQVAFLTPFAVKLFGGGRGFSMVFKFSLSFSIPLILIGVAISKFGSLFDTEHVKLVSGVLLLFLSLFMFRILKFKWGRKLKHGNFGSKDYVLGLTYGVLTIGRGAPFLLSVLIILSNTRNVLASAIAVLIYSQLMVLPILILVMAAEWRIKDKLVTYGKLLDFIVGVMLVVLAFYFITSALSLV
ncbi:MAG: hypothetical protein ACKD6N_00910 [Candidatus Bathyarchaeota archaeon]